MTNKVDNFKLAIWIWKPCSFFCSFVWAATIVKCLSPSNNNDENGRLKCYKWGPCIHKYLLTFFSYIAHTRYRSFSDFKDPKPGDYLSDLCCNFLNCPLLYNEYQVHSKIPNHGSLSILSTTMVGSSKGNYKRFGFGFLKIERVAFIPCLVLNI